MVVAHNSPFVRQNNVASNQIYPVFNQLNDGIRGCKLGLQDESVRVADRNPSAARDPETEFDFRDPSLSHILRPS